jgi:hypothetical protein
VWIEQTPVGAFVRESQYGFSILVAAHIAGLALSAGTVIWFDLRLLGLSMRRVAVATVYRQLMPWAFAGFAVMFVTGAVLLSGFATAAYGNVYARAKGAALLVAGVNALVYHRVTARRIAPQDDGTPLPFAARAAGLASIVAWAIVILAGRMMSYTLYSR